MHLHAGMCEIDIEHQIRKRDSPLSMDEQHSPKRIKKEEDADSDSSSLWRTAKVEDDESIQQLAEAFHQGRFREIRYAIEDLTNYHDPTISIYTFAHLLYPITGPLNQALLRAQTSSTFTPWFLDRLQSCYENAKELYQEDIDILIPLLSYETNNYGSTMQDRLKAILTTKNRFNTSITVWTANRVWDANEARSELEKKHKKLVVEDAATVLGLVFTRDERFDNDVDSEKSEDKMEYLEMSQRRVPLLRGEDLALLAIHCFELDLHDRFRGILLRMDFTLCLFKFADFLRIHIPFLKVLLPILPSSGIPYSDFVLVQFCRSAMYAFLHQCVGREPGCGGEERSHWNERRVKAERALMDLDQRALKEILGRHYEDTISMKGIRRKERDIVRQSVEREGT